MLWDCESCGTRKLLGVDHRHCPSCGAVQDENRRYFPPQDEAVPTDYDPDPDHECPYCGTPNSRRANNCVNCGGPMDGSEEVARRPTTTSAEGETVQDAVRATQAREEGRRAARRAAHSSEAQRARESARAEEHREIVAGEIGRYREAVAESGVRGRRREPAPSRLRDQYRRPAGIILGVLAAALAIWALFFWETTIEVEVESRSWERSQGIERYVQLEDAGWCDVSPGDRYDESRNEKQDGTKTVVDCRKCDCDTQKVKTGEDCKEVNCRNERKDNGNGSFSVDRVCDQRCDPVYEDKRVCEDKTHEEPVYRDWCAYKVDRWRENRRPSMRGDGFQEPTWPGLEYKECPVTALACERPGGRSEKYTVTFDDTASPDTHVCDFPQTRWATCEEGTRWDAVVKVVGGRFQCDRLTRTP
jgi:hypothetical protein